jgi:cobalamin biosynthesis protein CobD/CbiB
MTHNKVVSSVGRQTRDMTRARVARAACEAESIVDFPRSWKI